MDKTLQETSREARRMLASKVKNDWDYPVLPEWRDTTPHPLDPPRITTHIELDTDLDVPTSAWEERQNDELDFEPVAWQERDYSSSDAEDVAPPEFMDLDDDQSGDRSKFMFDPPDSATNGSLQPREETRKRKQAQVLEEEMVWNTGLAHFLARRDAWTCAKHPSTVKPTRQASSSASAPPSPINRLSSSSTAGTTATAVTTSSDSAASSTQSMSLPASAPSTPASSPPRPTSPPLSATLHPLLPVPPPLLPQHPVRVKITPAAYPEIYSKIILQSRTPTVPINLGHVTRTLVRGWVDEGNWPPRPTEAVGPGTAAAAAAAATGGCDAAAAKKRGVLGGAGGNHPHLARGVKAVGRVFGLRGGGKGGRA